MPTTNPTLTTGYTQIASGPCFMQNRGNVPVEIVLATAQPAETLQGLLLWEHDQRTAANNLTGQNVYARIPGGYAPGSVSFVVVS